MEGFGAQESVGKKMYGKNMESSNAIKSGRNLRDPVNNDLSVSPQSSMNSGFSRYRCDLVGK